MARGVVLRVATGEWGRGQISRGSLLAVEWAGWVWVQPTAQPWPATGATNKRVRWKWLMARRSLSRRAGSSRTAAQASGCLARAGFPLRSKEGEESMMRGGDQVNVLAVCVCVCDEALHHQSNEMTIEKYKWGLHASRHRKSNGRWTQAREELLITPAARIDGGRGAKLFAKR